MKTITYSFNAVRNFVSPELGYRLVQIAIGLVLLIISFF